MEFIALIDDIDSSTGREEDEEEPKRDQVLLFAD
jgi:hypothetical protein